jgi:hypothetical protein
MEGWKFTLKMEAHLDELVAKHGRDVVLKRFYEHIWWDDCTPGAGENARRAIDEIFEED